MQSTDYRLKFIADETFVEQIKADATRQPDNFKIQSQSKDEDPTRLGFDLATVVTVITIISGTLKTIEVASKIYDWWQKSNADKAILQTPFQTLELNKASTVTKEEIQKFLEAK